MAARIKMPHGVEIDLGTCDFVLDGDSAPPPKKGGAPKFSAHAYCGHTAGWIKTAIGTVVGLSPGDLLLDGDPAPSPERGRSPLPNFRSIPIVAERLDGSRYATCYGGRPRPMGAC